MTTAPEAPSADATPGSPGSPDSTCYDAPRPRLVARLLLAPLRVYRTWVSPALPPSCRFHPSCSAYAMTAVTRHGAVRGVWLATCRLLKCHPWHSGGHDPVPPARNRGVPDPEGKTPPTESEQQC